MGRGQTFTPAEMQVILHLCTQHAATLTGKFTNALRNEVKTKTWKQIAEAVNRAGGKNRNWRQIKKKWGEMQRRAREKDLEIRKLRKKTGGGTISTKLTPVQEQIIGQMEPMKVQGIEGGVDTSRKLDAPNVWSDDEDQPFKINDSSDEEESQTDDSEAVDDVEAMETDTVNEGPAFPKMTKIVIAKLKPIPLPQPTTAITSQDSTPKMTAPLVRNTNSIFYKPPISSSIGKVPTTHSVVKTIVIARGSSSTSATASTSSQTSTSVKATRINCSVTTATIAGSSSAPSTTSAPTSTPSTLSKTLPASTKNKEKSPWKRGRKLSATPKNVKRRQNTQRRAVENFSLQKEIVKSSQKQLAILEEWKNAQVNFYNRSLIQEETRQSLALTMNEIMKKQLEALERRERREQAMQLIAQRQLEQVTELNESLSLFTRFAVHVLEKAQEEEEARREA